MNTLQILKSLPKEEIRKDNELKSIYDFLKDIFEKAKEPTSTASEVGSP